MAKSIVAVGPLLQTVCSFCLSTNTYVDGQIQTKSSFFMSQKMNAGGLQAVSRAHAD